MEPVNEKEKEQQVKKKVTNTGCLAVFVVIVLVVIVSSFGGKDSKTTTPSSNINWASAEIIVDTAKVALSGKAPVSPTSSDSNFHDNITDLQVLDHVKEGQKSIKVFYKSGTVWDETHMVKKAGGTAILISSILFQNPKVEQVGVFAQTEMTDQYGKSTLETGVKIVLTREIANKIDWEGFSDRHVLDPGNIYRVSDNYYVHPGIMRNVKTNEVKMK